MAFVTPTPLVQRSSLAQLPNVSTRRPTPTPTTPSFVTAVLDTPASNPHLKEVSAGIMRDFLTRRAVHTVLYYFTELRDSASKNWLIKFDNFQAREKQDMFHDGEQFILRMLTTPPVKGEYVQRHPRGYFTRRFPFTIRPAQIANSVLESRKQLADEWAIDLRCVDNDNLEIRRMSFERLLETDQRVLESKRNLVFDSDVFASNQTPLRHANFRKLLVLCTQHAVTRLMPYLRDTSNHDYMWLMNFVSTYGSLSDGDDFIDRMMRQPIESRTNPTKIIDPRNLAMQILDLRSVIANEWIAVMHRIGDEQLELTRNLLTRSMDLPSSRKDE